MGGGGLTGSEPKAFPGGVSKRMLVVIVLMLAVIVAPVTVLGLPTSKIVVTVTNVDAQSYVYGYFVIRGVVNEIHNFHIELEEVIVWEFRVAIGNYDIRVECRGGNQTDYQIVTRSGSVSMFETEEVTLTLGLW